MVKIVDFKTYQRNDGSDFCALVVQGGIEAVKSKESNRLYFTARTVNVPCTFNESTCKALIGTDFPGSIEKVEVEPYDYAIPDTGEIVTLTHSYQYIDEKESILNNNVVNKELVL
uniref:hypothetical protein n=1 Tax=uncultured Polaribacter sp. TaxID=174711 RepID=UPI0026372000|nr:hypothetical protein [uncultured Polaribacter sp.]